MATSPGSSSSNPRKFSEKIALHNQKQAEETRAFDELMTDLTMSRVQFQKLQQLRLAQSRAQYYGGSLPNVNQISSSSAEFQPSVNPTDNIRGMRHHGLVERVSRSRLHPSHHRPVEKHGRPCDGSPYASVYLSPPSDNSWRSSALTLELGIFDHVFCHNTNLLRQSRFAMHLLNLYSMTYMFVSCYFSVSEGSSFRGMKKNAQDLDFCQHLTGEPFRSPDSCSHRLSCYLM